VKEGKGATFIDVDGNKYGLIFTLFCCMDVEDYFRYIDFCLGDTGAMTGHSPQAVVNAVTSQVKKGVYLHPIRLSHVAL
jgi:glutamate-1-semialdehyde 2,1-aminomutase